MSDGYLIFVLGLSWISSIIKEDLLFTFIFLFWIFGESSHLCSLFVKKTYLYSKLMFLGNNNVLDLNIFSFSKYFKLTESLIFQYFNSFILPKTKTSSYIEPL